KRAVFLKRAVDDVVLLDILSLDAELLQLFNYVDIMLVKYRKLEFSIVKPDCRQPRAAEYRVQLYVAVLMYHTENIVVDTHAAIAVHINRYIAGQRHDRVKRPFS